VNINLALSVILYIWHLHLEQSLYICGHFFRYTKQVKKHIFTIIYVRHVTKNINTNTNTNNDTEKAENSSTIYAKEQVVDKRKILKWILGMQGFVTKATKIQVPKWMINF